MEWLYIGRLVELSCNTSQATETLVRLYVLGDYIEDDHFSNPIIDTIVQNSSYTAPGMVRKSDTVDMAWREINPGSPLRKLLTRLIVCSLGHHANTPKFLHFGTWSSEVSTDVFAGLRKRYDIRNAIREDLRYPVHSMDTCEYHLHGEGYPKCS